MRTIITLSQKLIAVLVLGSCIPVSIAASGQLDDTFGTNGRVIFAPMSDYNTIRRLKILPDGKIVSFGGHSLPQQRGISFVFRNNSDGTFDTTFGTNGLVTTPDSQGMYFYDMAIVPNGNIILAGSVPNVFVETATGFIVYDRQGNRVVPGGDASFDFTPARRLLVRDDGSLIVVSGVGPNFSNAILSAIAYTGDTSYFDNSFGLGGISTTNSIVAGDLELWSNYVDDYIGDAALQADGRILVSGYHNVHGGKIVRLTPDGIPDTSFGSNGTANFSPGSYFLNHPRGLAVQPDGKILVSGISAEFGLYGSFIVRFNQNGTYDTTFGSNGFLSISEPDPNAYGIAGAIAVQSNGKIILGGERNGGFALMRFNENGTVDPSFGINGTLTTQMGSATRAAIQSLAWQSDGKLVAGGTVGDPASPTNVGLVRYRVDDSGVTVAGRVVAPNGAPLRNVGVSLIDSQGVSRRMATTSSFGLFTFDNVTVGGTFTVSASSKRYRFAVRTIQPTTNLTLEDIVGLE